MNIKNYAYLIFLFIASFLMGFQPLKGQGVPSSQQGTKKGSSGSKIKWLAHPFDHQVFIENKGQFESPQNGEKILYGAQVGNVYVFITAHGIIYKYSEHPEVFEDWSKKTYQLADPDDVNWNKKNVDHYLTATWKGSGNDVVITAGQEQTSYYTYPTPDSKGTIKANIFKTITCQNVYPGIDIKYMFPDGKDGFKYTLIIHPGADISLAKLQYEGAKKMKIDEDGNIVINSGWGQFTDHAPVSYYDGNNGNLTSGYQLNDNTESFFVKDMDGTKTLVIDPWSTNWSTSYSGNLGYNGAYDLDYDYAGNVYIYGSYNPYQLAKYNSSGVLQWTYNTSTFSNYYFGCFCVVKSNGVSFCFEGYGGGSYAYTDKISTTGSLISALTSGTMDEQWRASYDLCSNTIAIGGGGTSLSLQAATLDTNNNTYNSVNVLSLSPGMGYHDMCLIGSDPVADTTYMATGRSLLNNNVDNNLLLKLPMPSLSPTGLLTFDKFNFHEVGSVAYAALGVGGANGMNGMAVSPDWLYMYDGDTLQQVNKNTGTIVNKVNVSPIYYTWGGLAVDMCDNLYLGNRDSVGLYNSSLIYTGSIGAFPGNVYDVVLDNGVHASSDSILYVSGKGFVASIEIDPPTPPVIRKTFVHHCTCTCSATGTLNICGAPDTGSNVSYLWSDGQTTQTATGLCPGNTYTLTISLGCARQFQDTFNVPLTDTFHLVKTHINPTCGLCNGSATITASGGGSHYTYLWVPSAQTTATATGLCTGTYTVTVTDSCGDITTAAVTLTTVGLTVSPHIITNVKCNGGCTAITDVTVTGGVSPFTYHWSPTGGSKDTASGLCIGTDTIRVTDINGCTGSATISITQPPALVASIAAPVNPVCFGGTGTATAHVTGGVSPYTYLWANRGGTNATGTGLTIGTYTVTVTDSNDCTATASAILTQPAQVTAVISATNNVLCNGGTGTATVTAAGGTSPYTYLWANRGGTGATGTGLTAGTYTITVTDHNGCTGTARASITEPTILSDTITSIIHASCNLPNGKATITGRGATSPYTYLWTPSAQTTATATGLSVGTYSIIVTDKNNCTASATVNITQPSAVTATITSTKGVGCYNGGNGSATVSAGGGTSPYTYLWTPGSSTNSTATGLFAVGYTVTVSDANGCTATATTTLTEPTAVSVTISEPKLICKDSTGDLWANASGGTAPYRYNWSSGATTSAATITPIVSRNYSVIVTDANGCTASGQITLQYGPSFSVDITGKNSVCVGDSTTICANAIGALDGAHYLWEPMNNTNSCITVIPGSASVYSMTVIDGCGETTTATTTVYTEPSPTINMYADIYEGCVPMCIQFRNSTTIREGGIRQYVWDFGDGDTSVAENPEYCYSSAGQYNITLTATSDSGCSATFKKINMLNIYTRPQASFTYSPQPVIILTPNVQFTDESKDAYGIGYRWWDFGEPGDTISNLPDPMHIYRDTGSYCAKLVVMNDKGCTDTAINCLVIEPAFTLYIPSAFSPNGDGLNDIFEVKGKYVKDFEMYIFDRWGMEIYHSNDITTGWDGTVHGSSTISQEDVYIYKIMVTDSEGNQHSYIGNVTLLK